MKKLLSIITVILIVIVGLWFFIDDDEYDDEDSSNVASNMDYNGEETEYGTWGKSLDIGGLRDYYVDTKNAKNAVIMVYMIGSDLESDGGSATSDIEEMLDANIGENVKIVIQTGGASEWNNDLMSSDVRQRFVIYSDGISEVESLDNASMTDANELTDFIKWTKNNYPADRYILDFWDHGGGTKGGFGYDEIYDDDSLMLTDIANAVKASGVKFDIVGFDACLMGTIETAYALEPYADYLIASEEYEPANGWNYTMFLNEFEKNPAINSVELGKYIIDSFAEENDNEEVTLSIVDLREIPYVYEQMGDFLTAAEGTIQSDNKQFKNMSKARSNAREYCDGEIDQVDIIDMVNRTSFAGKDDLVAAIKSCVKYYNNSSLTGSNGLAMYFPYTDISSYGDMEKILGGIGFKRPTEFYDYFLSVMNGGRQRNLSSNDIVKQSDEDYSNEGWYQDDETDFDYGDEYGELYLEETDNGFELQLDDEVWDNITDIQLSAMISASDLLEGYDDGYIYLGYDNIENWTDSGNLLLDFDYNWVSINGIPVTFSANDVYRDDVIVYSGSVSAMLNDKTEIELVLEWEPITEAMMEQGDYELKGFVKGYRIVNNDTLTKPKGLLQLKKGDKLSFIYDYYDNDYNYVESTITTDEIIVTSQDDLKVSYELLPDSHVECWYTLKDIYQQELYTETIEFDIN